MAEEPPNKKRRVMSDIIILNIGENNDMDTVRVHKSCLEDRGGFFTAAVRAEWKEGQENKIPLPEDEIDIVATYVEWLYSGKIFTVHPDPSHKSAEYATQEEYWFIASLYLFAEKYLDDGFANAVIDTFTEALDSPNPDDGFYYAPSGLVIAAIYARTMSSSTLRRLMAQTYVNANKSEWVDEKQRKGFAKCPEFLMDVLAADPDDSLVQGRLYKRREEFYRVFARMGREVMRKASVFKVRSRTSSLQSNDDVSAASLGRGHDIVGKKLPERLEASRPDFSEGRSKLRHNVHDK